MAPAFHGGMNSLKAKLAAFQRSQAGLFVRKVLDDQSPNLAALLAWGTLSALLPLMLGILTAAGLVLRDPERLNQLYNTVLVLVPGPAAGPLGEALDGVRKSAGAPAGVIAVLLLLFNGSSFFANMGSVFDQAYHVEGRNFLVQRLIAIMMLVITTALLVIATLSLGLGSVVSKVPILPVPPVLGAVISWSISILSTFLLFVLLYKVLPHAKQGWRNVLPGTLLSVVLFFIIVQVFPLYMTIFPPNQAYAVFGVFLVFTFWLYLLGWVFVLGAELNAYMLEPARSVALAEATEKAVRGKAQFNEQTGEVEAEARGTAPALRAGGGPLGAPRKSAAAQVREQGQMVSSSDGDSGGGSKPTLAGRLLGFIALLLAVVLLRGKENQSTA